MMLNLHANLRDRVLSIYDVSSTTSQAMTTMGQAASVRSTRKGFPTDPAHCDHASGTKTYGAREGRHLESMRPVRPALAATRREVASCGPSGLPRVQDTHRPASQGSSISVPRAVLGITLSCVAATCGFFDQAVTILSSPADTLSRNQALEPKPWIQAMEPSPWNQSPGTKALEPRPGTKALEPSHETMLPAA